MMTTTVLHPVNWAFEKTSAGSIYAYGFNGGLAEPVITGNHSNEEEALAELCTLLRRVQRKPDPKLANEHCADGRRYAEIIASRS